MSRAVTLTLLGTAQDGGYPQVGCTAACCQKAWSEPRSHRLPCSLGMIDHIQGKRWLIDCTPAFPEQWHRLNQLSPVEWGLEGIFLTHAHMGHYAGLLQLGREVWAHQALSVYVMPRMAEFLSSNAPWANLITGGHIRLKPLQDRQVIALSPRLKISPVLVPHRDEHSETVGFAIDSEHKKALYISDIDHWNDAKLDINHRIHNCDIAWLDGTFFSMAELPNRDRSEIPHPTIQESLQQFSALSQIDKAKIHFFHLNHSNPTLQKNSVESQEVRNAGFKIAVESSIWPS